MEVEKLIKFGSEYLSDYFGAFLATVRRSSLEFEPIELTNEHSVAGAFGNLKVVKTRLNPKLIGFLIISILIGSVLNSKVPHRSPAPEIAVTMVMVLGCWLVFCCLVHLICKLLKGRATFLSTISVTLQVLAVVYVLSSLIAFFWGIAVTQFSQSRIPAFMLGPVGHRFLTDPIYAYFVSQFILILIYLPLATLRLHGLLFFKHSRTTRTRLGFVLVLLESAVFLALFVLLTLIIVGASKTIYEVHNVPLSLVDDPIDKTITSDLVSTHYNGFLTTGGVMKADSNIRVAAGKNVEIIDPNAIDSSKASQAYRGLLKVIQSGVTRKYTSLPANQDVTVAAGTKENVGYGTTFSYPDDPTRIDIFVPPTEGLKVWGEDGTSIAEPRFMITAHQVFGESVCGSGGGQCAVDIENQIREGLREPLPRRSGVDHDTLASEPHPPLMAAPAEVNITGESLIPVQTYKPTDLQPVTRPLIKTPNP